MLACSTFHVDNSTHFRFQRILVFQRIDSDLIRFHLGTCGAPQLALRPTLPQAVHRAEVSARVSAFAAAAADTLHWGSRASALALGASLARARTATPLSRCWTHARNAAPVTRCCLLHMAPRSMARRSRKFVHHVANHPREFAHHNAKLEAIVCLYQKWYA